MLLIATVETQNESTRRVEDWDRKSNQRLAPNGQKTSVPGPLALGTWNKVLVQSNNLQKLQDPHLIMNERAVLSAQPA
jgi:hypothetical protein